MKRMFLILMVVILSSCAPQYLKDEQKESIYSHDIELKKDQLKIKLLDFVNSSFKSSKAVIQTNDDGLLSGNGSTVLGSDFTGMIVTTLEFTFIVKYEDGKYRMKCIVKNIFNRDTKSTYDLSEAMWGNWEKEIKGSFDKFDNSLLAFLKEDKRMDF